jgi:DNA repair exonuclease SbcCD ATPase subunit
LLSPFFNFLKKKSEKVKKDTKYHNTLDQIKTEETEPSTTITIDEAKNIVKKIEDNQIKYLTDKIEKIRILTQKPLENIKSIISDLDTTKIEVHESSFESLVINSKKMVVNSIKKELSSSIPAPKTLNDVIKFYERLDSMVNKFSEISMSHKKVFNFFISKYADKLKTEFENISSLSMQCKYELDIFEKERQPIKNCFDNIDTLIQKNESMKLEEEKYKTKKSQRDELKLKLKKIDGEIQDLINSKHFIEANDIIKKIESLEIEKNNYHKELLNIVSKTSRAFNKYSYGLNKSIVHKIHIILEQPWKILQDLDTYLDLIKEVKSALIKGTIILKDSDKIETYLDNIINSLPNFKEREEKFNNEIKKLNNNKNINIISKVNELKRKHANYNQELKDIELYIKESESELLKNKSESDNLLSSIETYMNRLSKNKYHISISK